MVLILLGPIIETSTLRAGTTAAAISNIYGITAPAGLLLSPNCGHHGTGFGMSAPALHAAILPLRTDIRMSGGGTQLRTDRSTARELEEFVGRLSGLQLVLLVLLIIIPVSILTPLLAIVFLGGRCENCGRYRAMRITDREKMGYDESLGRGRHPIYKSSITRVCKYCGHTDALEQSAVEPKKRRKYRSAASGVR